MKTAADVRAWAREKGYEVGQRGHLPADVIDLYNRRHAPPNQFRDTNPHSKATTPVSEGV